jgi:hypothetical protein
LKGLISEGKPKAVRPFIFLVDEGSHNGRTIQRRDRGADGPLGHHGCRLGLRLIAFCVSSEVQLVHRGAEIAQLKVAIDLGGERRIAVPKDLLDVNERHGLFEQERRRRMPQIVKPKPTGKRLHPKLHVAAGTP